MLPGGALRAGGRTLLPLHLSHPPVSRPDGAPHYPRSPGGEGETRSTPEKLEETALPDHRQPLQHERERNAIEAERAVQNRKMAEYMTRFIGREYWGVVSGVTRFGVFVELPSTIEGMVPLSEMKDDYYEFTWKKCIA